MVSFMSRLGSKILVVVLLSTLALPTQAATLSDLLMQLQTLERTLAQYQASELGHPAAGVLTSGTSITVTNDDELAHAIASSTGGETILLAPGTYSAVQIIGGTYNQLLVGAIKITHGVPTLTAPVTIVSADLAKPAVVKSILVRSSNHWHFKGLAVRPVKVGLPASAVSFSGEDCSIEDSDITYGDASHWLAADWLALSGNGIGLGGPHNSAHNNTLHNVYMGIEVGNTAVGSQVTHNTVDGIGGDGMRLLADNTLVDSNLFKNFKQINDNHDDCAQSWGMVGNSVSQEGIVRGVTFQNNICINNENPNDPLYDNTQGFDSFDGSMQDWVVQNNVYVSTAYWGLSYSGAINMKIRNNTIIDSDAVVAGANTVRISVGANKTGTIQATGNTFENNIANVFLKYGSSSTVVNSQVVKMADYDIYFRDWRHGDVRLLPTSPIQGVGANLDPATVGSTVALTVITPPPPSVIPPTLTLTVSTTSVAVGTSATITWATTGATVCTATGDWSGNKNTSGTLTLSALISVGTKNYSLTCTGVGGSVTNHVTVEVVPAPVIVIVPTSGGGSSGSSHSGGSSGSVGNAASLSTVHSTTSVPISIPVVNPNQAQINQLFQLLALLQKLLALLLATKH